MSSYLLSCGVSTNQIKGVQGMGESDPVASNDTAAGRTKPSCRSIHVRK
ncbi:hypothetical protein SFC43_00820 [Bacteroides sp. CR5/BHMF/2]|nr:hypothetical protein [Bacteroides sp. CR5/BHMF/2]